MNLHVLGRWVRFDKLKFRFGALKHHFLQRDLSLFNLSRSCYSDDVLHIIHDDDPKASFLDALASLDFTLVSKSVSESAEFQI